MLLRTNRFRWIWPVMLTIFFFKFSLSWAGEIDLSKLEHKYNRIDWSKYTLEALTNKIPDNTKGSDISLLSIKSLNFLPQGNLMELDEVWKKRGNKNPKIIFLANGVYGLKEIASILATSRSLKKVDDHTYISHVPIYVGPSATLVIKDSELRLSNNDGVFLINNGKLFVTNSTITSWDESTGDYGPRPYLSKSKLLFYMIQSPRPYVLALNGSETYAGNSVFRGLGFKGKNGTFGISLNYMVPKAPPLLNVTEQSIRSTIMPTGWLIGNIFEYNFFGFYSNQAKDVVIVGNIYRDNLIYNIDPHDYSKNLIIARNLVFRADNSHGIIISREVNNSIIAENITLKNVGTGIMLDRSCETNLIYKNLALENGGNGISIVESHNNLVKENDVSRNYDNGMFVRNSCKVDLLSNTIFRNVKSGGEVSVANIDFLETRDFKKDPYQRIAEASFLNNLFESNLNSALTSKNQPQVTLKNNTFKNSGASYFSGDLEAFNREILSTPKNSSFIYKGINACQ